jgi:sulfopyruvate decarboxylase TPP-binding subunit
MWMDLLLLMVVLFPIVFWRGMRVEASTALIPVARELPSTLEVSELQAAPAGQPHPTLAP